MDVKVVEKWLTVTGLALGWRTVQLQDCVGQHQRRVNSAALSTVSDSQTSHCWETHHQLELASVWQRTLRREQTLLHTDIVITGLTGCYHGLFCQVLQYSRPWNWCRNHTSHNFLTCEFFELAAAGRLQLCNLLLYCTSNKWKLSSTTRWVNLSNCQICRTRVSC